MPMIDWRDPIETATARGVLEIKRDLELQALQRRADETAREIAGFRIRARHGAVFMALQGEGRALAAQFSPRQAVGAGVDLIRAGLAAWRQGRRLPR